MQTGNFTDWNGNILDLGPLYPFVGWEVVMVILLVASLVGWYAAQIRMEHRDHEQQTRMLREGDNLRRALEAEHTPERM